MGSIGVINRRSYRHGLVHERVAVHLGFFPVLRAANAASVLVVGIAKLVASLLMETLTLLRDIGFPPARGEGQSDELVVVVKTLINAY